MYISAHTNHSLAIEDEAKSIPLPKTTQEEISAKLQQGIPVERIMEGKHPTPPSTRKLGRPTSCTFMYLLGVVGRGGGGGGGGVMGLAW